jgi:cytochrome P450 family 144
MRRLSTFPQVLRFDPSAFGLEVRVTAGGVVDPLFEPAVVEDPHSYLAQLRAADPVHEVPGTRTFLVTRMDLIHEVVAAPTVFSSASARFLHRSAYDGAPGLQGAVPGLDIDSSGAGAILATADPPDHTRQRRVVARRLSTMAMQEMEPEFRSLVDGTLDDALGSGRIEWMSQVAEPLPMIMVARILGVPDHAAPRLKRQGYASVEAISGFVTEERLAELGEPMMDVGPVADAYLAARGAHHYDASTLIGVCGQAVEDRDLTDDEAFAILFLLIAAGGESTTSLTGTGVRILAERPELQGRLRRDPDLIPAFVEEACRIDPPFRGHYRRVLTDTTLGGVRLPAGSTVVLAWTAANHDGDLFPNPDDIDLERPNPRQHVGFGWGIHLCLGAPLARVEAKVAFERLLARTTSFSIDPSSPPLRHHLSLMVRRLVALPLVVETHPNPPD